MGQRFLSVSAAPTFLECALCLREPNLAILWKTSRRSDFTAMPIDKYSAGAAFSRGYPEVSGRFEGAPEIRVRGYEDGS